MFNPRHVSLWNDNLKTMKRNCSTKKSREHKKKSQAAYENQNYLETILNLNAHASNRNTNLLSEHEQIETLANDTYCVPTVQTQQDCSTPDQNEIGLFGVELTTDTAELIPELEALPTTCNTSSDQPLYENATIMLDSCITILLYLVFYCDIAISKVDKLCKLIALLLPQNNLLPKTKEELFRHVPNFGKMSKVYYCSNCVTLGKCDSCTSSKQFFLYHSLKEQLEQRFQDPNFAQHLHHWKTRECDQNIRDVFDGSVFNEMQLNMREQTIFLQANWDGVSPFKSSTHSLWPLYFVVLNLPPELRYLPENAFLVGLWFGKEKPSINLFLKHVTADLSAIETIGVQQTITSRIIQWFGTLLSTVCDLPAKSHMYCMSNFNGNNGCGFCIHTGISLAKRWVFPMTDKFKLTPRTESESKRCAILGSSDRPVNGLKGTTELMLLNTFSWVDSQTIDPMHQFSGIFKSLVKLWTKSGLKSRIETNQWRLFNVILTKQRVTRQFKRRVRSLTDYKYWKAHESLVFLLYLTPLMKPHIAKKYYDHLQLLTKGLRLLFSNCITPEDLATAEDCFVEFLLLFSELYGNEFLTLNFHHLLHLTDVVKRHGPLWSFSCFPFESYNKILTKSIHGSNHVEGFAAESLNLTRSIHQRMESENNKVVNSLISKSRVSFTSVRSLTHLLEIFIA